MAAANLRLFILLVPSCLVGGLHLGAQNAFYVVA